jgi:hypothetical protein
VSHHTHTHKKKKEERGRERERDNLEDLGINGSMLQKPTKNKQGMRMCTGFTWILTGFNIEVS